MDRVAGDAVVLRPGALEEVGVIGLLLENGVDDRLVVDNAAAAIDDEFAVRCRSPGKGHARSKVLVARREEGGAMVGLAAQVVADVRHRVGAGAGQRSRAAHTGITLRDARVHEIPEALVLNRLNAMDFIGHSVVLVAQTVGDGERRRQLPGIAEIELVFVILVFGLQPGARRRHSARQLCSSNVSPSLPKRPRPKTRAES